MKWFLMFVISISISIGQLYADENNDKHDKKFQHYQTEKPKTNEEALLILKSETTIIENKLSNNKLSPIELEEVHEISYKLESVVDKLREMELDKRQERALDQLDESVQALHYSSENHKEAETREWFAKLNLAIKEINDVF